MMGNQSSPDDFDKFLCMELDEEGTVLAGCGGGFESALLDAHALEGKNLGEALGLGADFDLLHESALAGEAVRHRFREPEDIVLVLRPGTAPQRVAALIVPDAGSAPVYRLTADFDLLPDRVFLLDRGGTYLDVRGGAGEDHGTWHDVLGRTVEDTFTGDVAETFLRSIGLALDDEEEKSVTYEIVLDTGLHHFEARFIPFKRDTVLAIVRNISDEVYAEEALKFSEKRYRGIVEDQTELICRTEPGGRLTFVNDAFVRYFGKPRAQLVGTLFAPAESEDEPEELEPAFASLGRENPSVTVIRRAIAGDGSTRWQEWTHRLLFNEGGEAREVQCIGHDITDRCAAEDALAQTELRFQRMAGLIDQAFWIFDEASSAFVYTSPALSRILGVPPEGVPQTLDEFSTHAVPESKDAIERAFRGRFEREPNVEIQIVRAEGTVRWLRIRGFLLEEIDGARTLCGVAEDITVAKQTERQLRKSEERLNLALDSTEDGLFDWDIRTGRLFVSKRWQSMIGYSEAEIRPHVDAWRALIHPEDRDTVLLMTDEHLASRSPALECEYRMRKRNGDWLWVLTRGKVTDRAEGQPTRMVGTNVDVSDRRRAQEEMRQAVVEAERAARIKSEFLATMSHEIRTPLNGVIGMLGLLQDTQLDPTQGEYVETARMSSDTLLGIINDILDFSKIEAGRMELEIISADLRQCIDEAVELCAAELAAKHLDTIVYYDRAIPSRVMSDPGRIRQILLNLASNAVKFTESGEIVVRAEVTGESEGVYTIRFSISDTGIGVAESAREKLFLPFSQIDASTTRKFGGTGLGLAISRRLVEMMSGRIGFEPRETGGSIFWFELPLLRDDESTDARLKNDDSRVLIAGTRATNLEALRMDLESLGCQVVTCAGAAAMREALKRQINFRVVFVDTGTDSELAKIALEEARRTAANETTPIYLLVPVGAAGAPEDLIDEYLFRATKPVRFSNLHSIVSNPLEAGAPVEHDAAVYESSSVNVSRGRVLVVEDNPVNQKVARLLLRKAGYRSDIVANGSEALDTLAAVAYDMVLMDCMMPIMDGYEATREIRAREAESTDHIPIIAMTAFALEGDRQKCLDAGMDEYLKKPLLFEQLAPMLAKFCPEHPRSSVEDTGEILDLDILKRTTGSDAAFLTELIQMIHGDLKNRVPLLEKAIETKSARSVRREAHTIKGHALHAGSEKLGRIMLEIERAADRGDIAACRARLGPVKSLAARLLRELGKHL